MKILIMEDEKLLKPPLPEALVILDVTAPGINSRQVAEEVETCIHSLLHRQEKRRRRFPLETLPWSFPQECCAAV